MLRAKCGCCATSRPCRFFDVAQTDPIEGAEPLPQDPTRRISGEDDYRVIAPLTAHLKASGWNIDLAPLSAASGYTEADSHRVTLAANLAIEQAAKTLIHETAHIELGHIDDLDQYRAHRGRMEVEAESVAFVVAGLVGFDTSAYSIGYITGWANEDVQTLRSTAARVLMAANMITNVIDGTV